jgi:hypothetical protein
MTGLWSVVFALNLAKRMDVKISVLLVIDPALAGKNKGPASEASALRSRLEKIIQDGRSEGTPIDYFLARGGFKDELIRFIQERKISLLVVDYPLADQNSGLENMPELLGEIKLRTGCRIEMVHSRDVK